MSEENNKTQIQVFGNGPMRVNGPMSITLADGTVEEKDGATFCRCGLSANKPYCDGSHKREGWEG